MIDSNKKKHKKKHIIWADECGKEIEEVKEISDIKSKDQDGNIDEINPNCNSQNISIESMLAGVNKLIKSKMLNPDQYKLMNETFKKLKDEANSRKKLLNPNYQELLNILDDNDYEVTTCAYKTLHAPDGDMRIENHNILIKMPYSDDLKDNLLNAGFKSHKIEEEGKYFLQILHNPTKINEAIDEKCQNASDDSIKKLKILSDKIAPQIEINSLREKSDPLSNIKKIIQERTSEKKRKTNNSRIIGG